MFKKILIYWKTILIITSFIAIILFIYQPAYLDYARRDHINFIIERNHFESDWSWFTHASNYNRSRLNSPGDYLLFRPLLYSSLAIQDILFRDNQLFTGMLSIILHLFTVLLIYTAFKLHSKKFLAFSFAAFFASQYAGIEMITWRHISFYMLSVSLSLASLLILLSNMRFKYALGGAILITAMMFHEIAPTSIALLALILFLTQSFKQKQLSKDTLLTPKLLSLLGTSVIIYFILNIVNWNIIRPIGTLNPGDSFTPSWSVFLEFIRNFLHYLGAGTRSVFDPSSIVITWKESDMDYVCFSWDILKDALAGYLIWGTLAITLISASMSIALRRILTAQSKASDIILLWANCSLLTFTAIFALTRLTIRHSNYSGISSYYWWFFACFYAVIIKYLIDEVLRRYPWIELNKNARIIGYAFAIVLISSQILITRGTIKKNYNLTFAKQIQQAIQAGKTYFTLHPETCLDTNTITVPKRVFQVFTIPFYLRKYNCGQVKGTIKSHPVRNSQGITSFQPGPYPKN